MNATRGWGAGRIGGRRAWILALLAAMLSGCGAGESGNRSAAPTTLAAASAKAQAADYTNVAQYLYVSYYGRPADPPGLSFWASYLATGNAPTDVAQFNTAYGTNAAARTVLINFGNSAESIALYGTDNATIVRAIYENLFNRAPDPGGFAFYTNGLNAGLITTAQAAMAIAGGAKGTDVQAIQNKVTVSTRFTDSIVTPQQVAAYDGLDANGRIRAVLASVDGAANVDASTTAMLATLDSLTVNTIALTGAPTGALMPGNSAALTAYATYADQSTRNVTSDASWSSSNTSVVRVSPTGTLTAEGAGQANVTATLDFVSGAIAVSVIPLQVSAYELRLTGDPQVMIADGQFGLHYVPDGHLTFRRTATGIDLWMQGGGGAVRLQGASFESLLPNPSSSGNAAPVFLPAGSGFEQDYVGPGTVLTAANGKDLLMVYHAEHQCGPYGTPFTAGIGLARSTDGGLTWTRQGQIVSSSYQPSWCTATRLNGAGMPVVILSRARNYYYMYYMEWLPGRPDQTYLARSPVDADAAPGSWTKYYRGEFSEPGLGGLADPVIQRPAPEDVTIWAGFASVSYNTFLQRYLAVFLTTPEFYYTASEDGIHWEPARKLGLLATSIPGYPPGTWLCYPSLLSLDQASDSTTSGEGYLYYSHGIRDVTPHYMERRAFTIIR